MVWEIHVKIGRRNGDQLLSSATAAPQVHATTLTTMVSKLIASTRFHSIKFPQLCSSNYSPFIGSNCSKFDGLMLCLTSNSISATRQFLRTCFCTRVTPRTISSSYRCAITVRSSERHRQIRRNCLSWPEYHGQLDWLLPWLLLLSLASALFCFNSTWDVVFQETVHGRCFVHWKQILVLYSEIPALALSMQERKTRKAGNIVANSPLQLLKALIRDAPLGNLGLESASRQRTRIDWNAQRFKLRCVK